MKKILFTLLLVLGISAAADAQVRFLDSSTDAVRKEAIAQDKLVFIDLYATWCGPCKMEMPDIQAMYEDLGLNEEDVVVLAVANPKSDQYPYNQDVSEDEVKRFLEENGYTYPVAMDTTGEVFAAYGVRAFPTTFMIDREGNVFGYVESTLTRDIMDSIVQQTLDGRRAG